MQIFITSIHVFACLFLMIVVLLQAGKGGGMGAAFGGGSNAGSVFGGSGAGNFLRKMTSALAAVFMITSIALAWMASTSASDPLRRYSEQSRQAKSVAGAEATTTETTEASDTAVEDSARETQKDKPTTGDAAVTKTPSTDGKDLKANTAKKQVADPVKKAIDKGQTAAERVKSEAKKTATEATQKADDTAEKLKKITDDAKADTQKKVDDIKTRMGQ